MPNSRKLFKGLAYGFALMLIASACGGTSGSSAETADVLTTTVTAAPVETAPPTTPAPAEEDDQADDPEDGEDDHDDDVTQDDDAAPTDEDDGATEADRVVQVTMDDFTFSPDTYAVTAGETIRFVVTNVGVIEHEFRLSNAHRIEEHLADSHDDDDHDEDADDDGHEEDSDIFLFLEAGESGEMTVTFPMDLTVFTEVACLVPGHYEAGMKAPLGYDT